MKIFYYCYGGTHSSVIAAAIHTAKISTEVIPTKEKIYSLPLYDKVETKDIGTPFLYGHDEWGNEVYVLGLGSKRNLIKNILIDYLQTFNVETEKIMLVAALPYVSFLTKLGGILSRKLGLVKIGRPIVTYSFQNLYNKYVKLVSEVKFKLNSMPNKN